MISLKLHIVSCSDKNYIIDKMVSYSYTFRKLYKNVEKLGNKNYKISIKSEAETKFKKTLTNKENTEKKIVERTKEINKLNEKQILSKKERRELFKLKRNLTYLNKNLSKNITFGGKANLRKISKYANNTTKKGKKLYKKYLKLYKEQRTLSLYLEGEANQKGNRFFNFDLSNNLIVYKPNKETKIVFKVANYKNYKNTFNKLQQAINDKKISVSVRLNNKDVILTFDEAKLNNYSVNESLRKQEVKQIKENLNISDEEKTSFIKEIYRKYNNNLKEVKLANKLNYRVLAIDSNPNFIGCSILDKINENGSFKIVKTFQYDLSELNKKPSKETSISERKHITNQRKHGICHIWKDIFKMITHYKCGYLVTEYLNFDNKKTNNKNKESNRQINGFWNRELHNNLTCKYCNTLGVIHLQINAAYSSTIGNLSYNYSDPVNASIEIGRRGVEQLSRYYIKEEKYYKNISLTEESLLYAKSKLSLLNKDKLRDVELIKTCGTWEVFHKTIMNKGLRYRINKEESDISYKVSHKLNHSKIEKVIFG